MDTLNAEEDVDSRLLNSKLKTSKSWADTLANGKQNEAWSESDAADGLSLNESYDSRNGEREEASLADVNSLSSEEAKKRLPALLNAYILSKCNTNEQCRRSDFDGTAREALQRISFLQAMQAIEHFATSVSVRIQKRPAYLMGILRGQEGHWDKSRAAAQLSGGSAELLALPNRVLYQIAVLCLEGNCLPSDFIPEVCLALHRLNETLALKALHAFNSNKRIVAGCRGGVLNRPRFFERLIQNVAEQNSSPTSNSNSGEDDEENGKKSREADQKNARSMSSEALSNTKNSSKNSRGENTKGGGSKRSVARSLSLTLSVEEANHSVTSSPGHNAWSSPLASSNLGTSSWSVEATNGGGVSPAPSSMSVDNSQFQQDWGRRDHDTSFQDARSISSLSVQTGDSHSNMLGSNSCPPTPSDSRSNKIVGSPVQAVQRGWESPLARQSSAQSSPGGNMMPVSLVNSPVIGWSSVPPQQGQPRRLHRSGSAGEAQDMWKQGHMDMEYGGGVGKFSSLFAPSQGQSRSNTPTAQQSAPSTAIPKSNKQLQPQNEEPETVSESSMLDLEHLRNNLDPQERADVLEKEVVKLNKQLRAYSTSESNLIAELMQAKSRIRGLEGQYNKLSKDCVASNSMMRKEVLTAVARTFDRMMPRSSVLAMAEDLEQQQQLQLHRQMQAHQQQTAHEYN